MDDHQPPHAPAPEVIRVSFGPKPHQEIRLEVAEYMLHAWREKDPKRFGEALQAALLDTRDGHNGSR